MAPLDHFLPTFSCLTRSAFAAKLTNGRIVTWGDANAGGDCLAVNKSLIGVKTIYSTDRAFAAHLKTGQIITFEDFMHRVKKFLTMKKFHDVCKNCTWYSYNICAPVIEKILGKGVKS